MANSKFKLVCKKSNYPIKKSDSLKSIFEHIQFYIDKPENYQVEEHCFNGVDAIKADFLIKNYQIPEDVPVSLLDI